MSIKRTKGVKNIRILRVEGEKTKNMQDVVAREFPLTIVLNDKELITLLCTPVNLDYLAVGFLFTEGLIKKKKDIKKLQVDKKRGVVWVETNSKKNMPSEFLSRRYITTGCGKGTSFIDAKHSRNIKKNTSEISIRPERIITLMREFQEQSETHRMTGGVHSAALCDADRIILFAEDIGRHSAIDKILGQCLLKGISTKERILITSGRISSEILLKIANGRIPIIVSKSAPTDLGVSLSDKLGITLIGFARGSRMNVYSGGWRVMTAGQSQQAAEQKTTRAAPSRSP